MEIPAHDSRESHPTPHDLEPLLDPANERFTILPLKFPAIWDMYKKQ